MAEMALPMTLQAMNMGAANFDTIKEPIVSRYNQARGRVPRDDPDVHDARHHQEKGMILRRRCDVGSDEEIVEVVRHRGQVLPRRPGLTRGTSSMDNLRDGNNNRGNRRRRGGAYGSEYDSESSVPPRNRVRPRSENSSSPRKGGSSSSDTSSIGSSTDEEKQIRKMKRKKWVTAALASVATIHAASKVYSSIENHDKRIIQVEKGEISPEEAHKKQRSARWQDAAAIGIAALGIKGAISEWKEVKEEHGEHMEMMRKKEEHHKKRLERERRMKARGTDGYYKGRDGQWYYDGPEPQYSEKSRALDGPRQNERLMIEDGRGSDRGRDSYGGRDRSRARSIYGSPDNRDRYRSRSRRARRDSS